MDEVKPNDCDRFRELIYHSSQRLVDKNTDFLNAHERSCLACVEWMFHDAQSLDPELLDAADKKRLKSVFKKLKKRLQQLRGDGTAKEPTVPAAPFQPEAHRAFVSEPGGEHVEG